VSSGFGPSPQDIGPRFNIVSVVPLTTLVVFLITIVLSGPPDRQPDLALLRERLASVRAVDFALALVAIVALSLLLNPFQVRFVKFLEGYWPERGWIGWIGSCRRQRYIALWDALDVARSGPGAADEELAGLPARTRLMPTRLGNVLRHAEDLAGQRYGLSAVQIIPRLYPLMPSQMTAIVDDARNGLDVAASFVFVWLVATVSSSVLLISSNSSGPWLAIPLVTYMLAYVSYLGSLAAARAYGQTLVWAIDLYRFALYEQLHIALPATHREELKSNERLVRFLRGRWLAYEDHLPRPAPPPYRHPESPSSSDDTSLK
jgi:hypothetical protein